MSQPCAPNDPSCAPYNPRLDRHGWHLQKNISVGHIITTVTVACGVIIWGLNVEKRVELNTARIAQGTQQLTQHEQIESHRGQSTATRHLFVEQAKLRVKLDSIHADVRELKRIMEESANR